MAPLTLILFLPFRIFIMYFCLYQLKHAFSFRREHLVYDKKNYVYSAKIIAKKIVKNVVITAISGDLEDQPALNINHSISFYCL